jgi:nucleoside-diphosphate-sugar epimerase
MRRILGVGGAGYVGCAVTEVLVQPGYMVRELDRR